MRHTLCLVALLLADCSKNPTPTLQTEATPMSQSIPNKTITLDQLEAMFDNIAENTDWDLSRELLWGYFFTHREPKALEPIRDELVAEGYRFVKLFLSDEEDQDGPPVWWLHVEKEEIHTPQSLDRRNDTFYRLAARHGVDSYDGMDVGPVQSPGE